MVTSVRSQLLLMPAPMLAVTPLPMSLSVGLAKGDADRAPVISEIKRVSKPGRRVYVRRDAIPRVVSGFGLAILSTSKGVMTSMAAKKAGLGGELIAGLQARGRKVITPEAPAERAGNVCFLADDADGLTRRLAERRVLVWSGDGRVRVSAHLHNDAADVQAFFEALDAVG